MLSCTEGLKYLFSSYKVTYRFMKKILILTTSSSQLLNTELSTGLWLGEFTEPYYHFIDHDCKVVIASPEGGQPPIDPTSELTENITASNRRFQDDEKAKYQLAHTQKLDDLEVTDFDGLFLPGGHGPMFDLASSELSGRLISAFYSSGKPIGAVCHGPAALLKAAEYDPTLLNGRKVTGFSDIEEKLVFKNGHIPFSLEKKLIESGGDYTSATIPFLPHTVTDGLLVTGQNPASSQGVAEALLELMHTTIELEAQ